MNVYALAAANGDKKAIMLSNIGEACEIELDLDGDFAVYLLDKDTYLEKAALDPGRFVLPENTVALIKNY